MKKQKEKNKHRPAQCLQWYLSFIWQHHRKALVFVPMIAFVRVGIRLTELFVVPSILKCVEEKASFTTLLATVGVFTLLLLLFLPLGKILENCTMLTEYTPATMLEHEVIRKANVTAWSNTIHPKTAAQRQKAIEEVFNYDAAPTQVFFLSRTLLCDMTCFAVYLLMLTNLDPLLALVAFVTGVIGYFATRNANKWRYEHRAEESKLLAKIAYVGHKAESVELAKDIRIYGLRGWLSELNRNAINAFERFVAKAKGKQLLVDLIGTVLNVVRSGVAYALLIGMTLSGEITAAEFVLYFTAVNEFTEWISGILRGFGMMHRYGLQLATIREFTELPEPFRFEGGEPIPKAKAYELKLEQVSYRYPEAENDSLQGVNLTVHAGEKIAVVGTNGAGKTTLVRLLCGLIDPTEGRVLLNGIDIRNFNRDDYYRLFSTVFQESDFMELTVAENVAQKLPQEIDYARVENCLDAAGLKERAAALPNGVQTHLGKHVWDDAVLLSGGEKQRVMLARALYKDGPILLLDEPTAALDPIAENDIYMKYNEMTKGKTAVFVSHRLASTRFCDRILFLKDGAVAEEGTHEELLRKNGLYATLFDVQSRYYKEGGVF